MVPPLALVFAQTQPSVTLSIGASRLPVILEKLSGQTGIEFGSGPQLQDEILFVSVKNAPLSELKSEIAHVTHCTWEKNTKGGFDLLRTHGQEAADDVAENRQMLSMLMKALSADRENFKAPDWTVDETPRNLDRFHESMKRVLYGQESDGSRQSDYITIRDFNVNARGMNRLIGAVEPAIFADQRPWEDRRYTQNPNEYQFNLPASANDAIDVFEREEQAALSKLAEVPESRQIEEAQEYGLNRNFTHALQGPIVALIRTHLFPMIFQWEVAFCDSGGNVIASSARNAQLGFDAVPGQLKELGVLSNNKVKFPRAIDPASRKTPLTLEERALVATPLEHDPLGLLCDDGLRRLGTETHREIVAALPDECLMWVRPNATVSSFCMALSRCVSFALEDGRLLISPLRRDEAFKVRTKRAPLEALLRQIKDDPIPLELGASYACAQNELAAFSPLEGAVFGWEGHPSLSDGIVQDLCDQRGGQRLRLKFYGQLSASQRQRLANGGIQFGELEADQQSLMTRWLYGAPVRFDERAPASEQNLVLQRRPAQTEFKLTYLEQDPTFSLSQGIPPAATITVSERKSLTLVDSDTGKASRSWSCANIGYIAAQQERGEFLDQRMGYPVISRLRVKPARTSNFSFVVKYTPRLRESFELVETTVEASDAVKVQDLPAPWLSEINKVLEAYRRAVRGRPPPAQQQQTGSP